MAFLEPRSSAMIGVLFKYTSYFYHKGFGMFFRRNTVIAAVILLLGSASFALFWNALRPQREISALLTLGAGANGASQSVSRALNTGDAAGFARVTGPRELQFPADHGPHPEYQTEWFYYTGNLQSSTGRQYGYQLTFFRRGIAPSPPNRASNWAARDIYFAHFAVTDVDANKFFATAKVARGGDIGLAGASATPFKVFVEDWSTSGTAEQPRLRAASDQVAIDLTLQAAKPMTLQGDRGYSPKSTGEGNATYYYSFTRMNTSGTITIDGTPVSVTGLSWFDREWGTNPLSAEQIGWDWFGLHLNDGRDLMIGRIRRKDGGSDLIGSITGANSSTPEYFLSDVTLTPLDTWTSPRTGISYPSRWRLAIPAAQLDLTIEAMVADQELNVGLVYWEGAVAVRGNVEGSGYAELTGYE